MDNTIHNKMYWKESKKHAEISIPSFLNDLRNGSNGHPGGCIDGNG